MWISGAKTGRYQQNSDNCVDFQTFSKDICQDLTTLTTTKQLTRLHWYILPQSFTFTANHFLFHAAAFIDLFISLLLFHCALHLHLLPPFPAAQQTHNWIVPNRPPDKSISYSLFCLVKFYIFMLCPVSRSLIVKFGDIVFVQLLSCHCF